MDKVKASATSVGDSFFLSETDKQVLALALEIKARGDNPQIVTDDYSIQNVAKQLGLEYVSLVTFGIKRLLTWIRYCPACHRTYPANFKARNAPYVAQPSSANLKEPRKQEAEKDSRK